jgi:hypothetical protein
MSYPQHSHYACTLLKFFEYLKKETKCNLTMGIGISVVNLLDIERNLYFDIKMSDYGLNNKELCNYLEERTEELFSSFIFNFDFNIFCILNNAYITRFNEINKIKSIVFDSSTFKFLNNIKFIGILYYLALDTNGEIYIETNNPVSVGIFIDKISELYQYVEMNNSGFKYQNVNTVTNKLLNLIPIDNLEKVKKCIYSKEQIYSHNLEFFKKWFYGSKVELLEDDMYPITNSRYPIKRYYKITKVLSHTEILEKVKNNVKEYNKGLGQRSYSIVDLSIFR